MTDLLLANGFETGLASSTLTTTEFDEVSVVSGAAFQTTNTPRMLTGGYSLQAGTGSTSGVAYGGWDWGSDQATIYALLYVNFDSVPSAITAFASIVDSAGNLIASLRVNASGHWEVYNYGNSTAYDDTGGAVVGNVWYRVELKLHSDAAAGTIDLKVNGALSSGASGITGIDTEPVGLPRKLRVGVTEAQASAPTRYIDDCMVRLSDWIGMGRTRPLRPFGVDVENWTVVDSGNAGWQTQLELPWVSNPSSDYVKSSTANQEERWTVVPLGSTSGVAILGAVPMLMVRRGSASAAAGVLVNLRSGSTDGPQSAALDSGSTTWQTFRGVMQETDPATGSAWTLSGLNAAILRLVHDSGTNEADVCASFVYAAFTMTAMVAPAMGQKAPSITPAQYLRRGRVLHHE